MMKYLNYAIIKSSNHHIVIFAVLLAALRFLHFGNEIDAPHDWRQCDTAYYIRDFYQNGIDLLHPAVCWMGASDTLALEFPLPEAVVAGVWRIGGESIPLARLVFLCFFTGALYYFFRIADLLFGKETARLATLVYAGLPLSIFYSRAVHIDFSVVFLSHAMFYYYLRGVSEERWAYVLASGAAALLAFLIKAPYAFYFTLPMLYYAVQQGKIGWFFRWGLVCVPAAALFLLWQGHVNAINGAAPDLGYIAHYRKMTQNTGWYFGSWYQRASLYSWKILLERGIFEVLGIGGILLFIAGSLKWRSWPERGVLSSWIIALLVYVLVFFNLNFVHNYYQIPLLAPAAVICGWGIAQLARGRKIREIVLLGILLLLNIVYAERSYFQVPEAYITAGRIIRERTPADALVIVTYGTMDCRDPRILYRARRRGWSVEEAALNAEVLRRLPDEQGAGYWAFVGASLPAPVVGISNTPQVLPMPGGLSLYLYDLKNQ